MSKLEAETWACSWKLVVFWFNSQQERVFEGHLLVAAMPNGYGDCGEGSDH